jgi:hypothetical protein
VEFDAALMISSQGWCLGLDIRRWGGALEFSFRLSPLSNFSASNATLRLFRQLLAAKHRRPALGVHQRSRPIRIDFHWPRLNRYIVLKRRLLFVLPAKHVDQPSLANSRVTHDQNLESLALKLIH